MTGIGSVDLQQTCDESGELNRLKPSFQHESGVTRSAVTDAGSEALPEGALYHGLQSHHERQTWLTHAACVLDLDTGKPELFAAEHSTPSFYQQVAFILEDEHTQKVEIVPVRSSSRWRRAASKLCLDVKT